MITACAPRVSPPAAAGTPRQVVAVTGVGVWMPGTDDGFDAPFGGGANGSIAGATRGASSDVAGTLRGPTRARRRASLLTQMVADVAAQATSQAGVSLAAVPVVLGSAFGEMATTLDMLGERESSGDISPTKFHNSVHNNAAGQLSIVHGNRGFSTSLAAGHDTVAMVLLESLMLLAERGGQVLAIVADESLPALLLHGPNMPAVAAALLLSADAATSEFDGVFADNVLGWIGDLRQTFDGTRTAAGTLPATSPCAAIFPLLTALAFGKRPLRIDLTPGDTTHWSIAFAPARASGRGAPASDAGAAR